MNEGPNANAENHSSVCGETSVAKSQSHKAGSSHAFVQPKKEQNPDGGFIASLSNEKPIAQNGNNAQLNQESLVPKKELDMLERNVNIDARTHTPISGEKQIPDCGFRLLEFNQVSIITKTDPDNLEPGQNPDMGKNSSTPSGREGSDLSVQEKSLVRLHDTPISTSLSDQEKMTYSARREKTLNKLQPRRNPDHGVNLSLSTQESNSSRIREKALDDGYNWRKYGQKLVKGNVFVRSYYKCTFSNCRAKKQAERSHDGRFTDIKYIGKHEHPKPQSSPPVAACDPPLEVRKADALNTAASGETSVARPEVSQPIKPAETPRDLTLTRCNKSMVCAVSQSHNPRDNVNDDCSHNPKRQKIENASIDDNQVKKTYFESRQVVQMMSEVDIVNDGYRWRKYGQKLVKGNPNPRSYYRCSNAGCTVKKHVERASYDPKVVIATYEGSHDHDMPGSKAVAQSMAKNSINGATMSGESGSELVEQKPVAMERVVHIGTK